MPLIHELLSSVHLSGITFTHHGSDILALPNCAPSTWQICLLQLFPNLILMSLNGIRKHFQEGPKQAEILILDNINCQNSKYFQGCAPVPTFNALPLPNWKANELCLLVNIHLHVHNQDFFRAGKVSWNECTLINILFQHTKRRPCWENVLRFFSWMLLKLHFK